MQPVPLPRKRIKMAQLYLDNTMIGSFHTCPQKFYWRHIRHLVPDKGASYALEFGKAIHSALEVFYKGGTVAESLSIFLDEYTLQGDSKRTPELGLLILSDYFSKYLPEQWKVLQVEVPMMIELSEDILFCGRADLIVEWIGQTYIVDHKTTSNMHWVVPKPNHQMTGYTYQGKVLGVPVDGVIFNMLGVFKTKREYHRLITTRSEEDLTDWKNTILTTKVAIDHCLEKEWFPKHTNSCWNCEYKEVCNASEKTLPSVIEQDFKEEKWEPWKVDKEEKKKGEEGWEKQELLKRLEEGKNGP